MGSKKDTPVHFRLLVSFQMVQQAVEQGLTGERFADTVERIGFENVQEQLLSDGLLQRKEDNLKLDVKGGATC